MVERARDFTGPFVESVIPTPDGGFQTLSAQIPGSASLTVGVPSRLYFTKTKEKPLAGVRLGYTGPAIQNLIGAGAQVVGLQKTSQFANGESAARDWVDYRAPFNPRDDGYQDPSSSSSDAGASVAGASVTGYEWPDIAIGSDTGGSIRGPASVQGLLGNRPSTRLVSLDNVTPLSPTLDTPGFLVRDPCLWDDANAALYLHSSAASPTFVGGTATPINMASAWAASIPAEANGSPIPEFLNTTYPILIIKEQTALVREPFYRDYAAAHGGRRPFVNPVPLARWGYGDTVPDSALDDAIRKKTVFLDWFNKEILPPSADPSERSSSLLLYVSSQGGQNPRNRYRSGPGAPGRVFPLGHVSSRSAITQHDEFLPVGVSVMAVKGCDGLLVKLAQDLVEAERKIGGGGDDVMCTPLFLS
ncbi:amidase signature domain-containing protein [Immersiella caudata]|uniref:Amidase signature domain-containing protein n=1 Tax=Immersiella caudata TaxID=314043 RepID=A0AA39XEI0_9PEZI|nr:amidase signature domain-containing protein [Immersiella caudata]